MGCVDAADDGFEPKFQELFSQLPRYSVPKAGKYLRNLGWLGFSETFFWRMSDGLGSRRFRSYSFLFQVSHGLCHPLGILFVVRIWRQPKSDFGFEGLVSDALAVIKASGSQQVIPVALAHSGWVAIDLRRRLGTQIQKLVLIDWIVLEAPWP
ncbi:MAG: hypothetical protein QXU87_09785, partial [Candidatus Caldarchaeum sp.]